MSQNLSVLSFAFLGFFMFTLLFYKRKIILRNKVFNNGDFSLIRAQQTLTYLNRGNDASYAYHFTPCNSNQVKSKLMNRKVTPWLIDSCNQ